MTSHEQAQLAYQQLPIQVKSLMLSTVSPSGIPHASFAPFVMDREHRLYLYTSSLSTHTQNLLTTPQASVLIMEDEAASQQIFARRRITYDCQISPVSRDQPLWISTVDNFEQRFGNIIQILRQLPDFQVFQLVPFQGRFVLGFGSAFEVNPNDIAQIIPKPISS